MEKQEFLDGLRKALEGEVTSSIIEQNIQYYNQYISSTYTKEEQAKIIRELGDPRLIAKSIIEANRASSDTNNGQYYYEKKYQNNTKNNTKNKNHSKWLNYIVSTNLKWYNKLIIISSILLLLLLIIFISSILLRLLFIFVFPIIILIFLLWIFRKR